MLLCIGGDRYGEVYCQDISPNVFFERNPDPSAQTQISTRWIWSEELNLLRDPMAFLESAIGVKDCVSNPNSAELDEYGYNFRGRTSVLCRTEDASWYLSRDQIARGF